MIHLKYSNIIYDFIFHIFFLCIKMFKEYFEIHNNQMDQNQDGQLARRTGTLERAYGTNKCDLNHMIEPAHSATQATSLSASSSYLRESNNMLTSSLTNHINKNCNNYSITFGQTSTKKLKRLLILKAIAFLWLELRRS